MFYIPGVHDNPLGHKAQVPLREKTMRWMGKAILIHRRKHVVAGEPHLRPYPSDTIPVEGCSDSTCDVRTVPAQIGVVRSGSIEPRKVGRACRHGRWALLGIQKKMEPPAPESIEARGSCSGNADPTAANYLAYSLARISRITVTLIWPGYSRLSSIFWAICRESSITPRSSTSSGLTMTRTSRPA